MLLANILTLTYHKFPYVLAGILGIGAVVTVHEFGHFIFGKLFNVHIPEFSIGMGPKLYSKQIGETTFSISAIPVGAYVAAGQDPHQAGGHHRTIQAKPYWQRVIIVSGGVLFNLMFAYTLLVGLSMHGIPTSALLLGTHTIEKIEPNSPADKAGLLPHDRIIAINHIPVEKNADALLQFIAEHPCTETSLEIIRNNETCTILCTLGTSESDANKGSLGIHLTFDAFKPTTFFKALSQSASLVTMLCKKNFFQLLGIFKKKSVKNLSGPLGMIYIAIESASKGLPFLLLLLVLINIGLAVLNIFPLPILDGGHLAIYTIEAILGRSLSEKAYTYISYGTAGLFITLFVYLTFQDSLRIFFHS